MHEAILMHSDLLQNQRNHSDLFGLIYTKYFIFQPQNVLNSINFLLRTDDNHCMIQINIF